MNTILITGGARRIGAEICKTIANLEFKKNLIIHYNNSHNEALELKSKLSSQNTAIHLFQADLTKENDLQSLIAFIKNNFGSINVLLNNASIFEKNHFLDDINPSKYLDIHIKTPLLLSKLIIDNDRSNKDYIIINLLDEKRTSNKEIQNYGNYFYYSMTKHMMFILHQYLKKEISRYCNIKIYGLLLGLILSNDSDSEHFKKNNISQNIMEEKIIRIKEIIQSIFMQSPGNQDYFI